MAIRSRRTPGSPEWLKNLTLPSRPPGVETASLEKLAALGEKDGIFGDKKPDPEALFS